MKFDRRITDWTEEIKADKTYAQPYKNKMISTLADLRALGLAAETYVINPHLSPENQPQATQNASDGLYEPGSHVPFAQKALAGLSVGPCVCPSPGVRNRSCTAINHK